MKWKAVVCLLGFVLFSGGAAFAQEESPRFDVFAGYSYVRADASAPGFENFSLNGGSASLTYHLRGWVSAVADFGGYTNGSIPGVGQNGTLSTYLFGPKFSYRSYHHFTPFAETLFGVARGSETIAGGINGTQNAFAMTAGVGVDYRINNRFSLRPLQVDYLLTRFAEGATSNQSQNNLRASTGIVVHF